MSAYSVVSFSVTVEILNRYIGEAGGSADQKKNTDDRSDLWHDSLSWQNTVEYNCRYFIMTFRKQIGEYKFGKNCFHTLQSTMSHRPLTNSSSLKITAAYSPSFPSSMGCTFSHPFPMYSWLVLIFNKFLCVVTL